ncbi:sulfatase [Luteolibacter yonseiensis]|uniref:Sulfatase n=1 Tax=Luteolibacter yonseiensis TaxID=1144680 RepID=A0A934VDX7_9BACT|nr:sulfatase [Luteolibacter yonseiensis]MBK1818019.1 sulfatase [Luteolibacter yonseiensis]
MKTLLHFALLLTFAALCKAAPDAKRPNVLFIFADDWGRYAGIYHKNAAPGSPLSALNAFVKTPNFDAIASQGVLFRNAHVNAPSCTPCRSSLLSGQYFWRTGRGAILRGAVWDPAIPSFPLLLRDSGYSIGKSYKVWSPGTPVDAPFDGQKYNYQVASRRFGQFSQHVTKLIGNGRSSDAAKQELYDEVRGNFRLFLDKRDHSQPFHYWFGPTNTHRAWEKGSGKALWNIDPDSLKGKLPPFLPDVPEVREDLADYLGEVAALDAAIGTVIDELKKSGEYDNTLIIISGDHGAPGFPNGKCNLYTFGTGVSLSISGPGVKGGRVVDDFVNLTDLAPTILEAAQVPVPAAVTGRSLWSILRSEKSGQVDPAWTWTVTGRERHVAEAREGYLPYPQRAIHSGQHLYIINFKPDRYPMGRFDLLDTESAKLTPGLILKETRSVIADIDAGPTKSWLIANRSTPQGKPFFDRAFDKRPREELYDLAKDPYETVNVASDPAYAAIRKDLETRLLAELKRTGDPRLENDGAYFENPPLSGPAD